MSHILSKQFRFSKMGGWRLGCGDTNTDIDRRFLFKVYMQDAKSCGRGTTGKRCKSKAYHPHQPKATLCNFVLL